MKKKKDAKSIYEKLIVAELGQRIATKRRKAAESQERFSGYSNVSEGGLSMLEKGTGNPTLVRLLRISRELQISLSELFKNIERANIEIEKARLHEHDEYLKRKVLKDK